MSCWVGYVGKILVKEEYVDDLIAYMEGRFCELKTQPFLSFVKEWENNPFEYLSWRHDDWKAEWVNDYVTHIDKDTRIFSYGVSFNSSRYEKSAYWWEFDRHILDTITEKELIKDIFDEEVDGHVENRNYMLELGKVYDWDVISSTYPDMYAIITDIVRKNGSIIKCRLLEIVPYEKKTETVLRYRQAGIEFDCERTTFRGPWSIF